MGFKRLRSIGKMNTVVLVLGGKVEMLRDTPPRRTTEGEPVAIVECADIERNFRAERCALGSLVHSADVEKPLFPLRNFNLVGELKRFCQLLSQPLCGKEHRRARFKVHIPLSLEKGSVRRYSYEGPYIVTKDVVITPNKVITVDFQFELRKNL